MEGPSLFGGPDEIRGFCMWRACLSYAPLRYQDALMRLLSLYRFSSLPLEISKSVPSRIHSDRLVIWRAVVTVIFTYVNALKSVVVTE